MATAENSIVKVAFDAPHHTGLAAPLDYLSERMLSPGTLLNVPLGKRDVPGIVWDGEAGSPGGVASDGKSLFVATGNTMSPAGGLFSAPTTWGAGVRLRGSRPA